MGFLNVLGKIGKGIGKVGASFIPGGSLVADAIETGADLLGGGAKAAKDGRLDEATMQAQMNSRNNADTLGASQFNAGQQENLIKRALAARMLQDQQAPTDPRVSKHYAGPSAEMKALAAKYGGMADQDVMGGGYKVNPTMSSIPKSGMMEKIGGVAGTAGGILGILGKLGGNKPGVDQVGGGMGGSTGAPNLPYQPLPRAGMTIPSDQWTSMMPMPGGDSRSLSDRLKKAGSTPPVFEELSGVNF